MLHVFTGGSSGIGVTRGLHNGCTSENGLQCIPMEYIEYVTDDTVLPMEVTLAV